MIDCKRMSELQVDEVVWIIFILLSLMNIFGDECERDYCVFHYEWEKKLSKNIFTFTIFISLLLYFYLEYQRYQKLIHCKKNHQNSSFWEIRCFGGMLVIIATILFLYCQIVDENPVNPFVV